jgi:hypothetical protein
MEDSSMQNQILNNQAELISLAIRGIDFQIAELEQKRVELLGQTGASRPSALITAPDAEISSAKPQKRRKISAAHRAKLKAAAKKRWANARAAKK